MYSRRLSSLVAPLTLLIVLASATSVHAATPRPVRDWWQVVTTVTPRLEADGMNLFRLTPNVDRFRLAGRPHVITWNNFSGRAVSQAAALRAAGEPARGLLLERPLSAVERRRFVARVLWHEADVLIVPTAHPACTAGLTLDTARGVLDGRITRWRDALPASSWPDAHGDDEIRAYVPPAGRAGHRDPSLGVTTYGASTRAASEATRLDAVEHDPNAVSAVPWSARRARPAGCPVPIDGVTPTDATVRSAAYGPAFRVWWVTLRTQDRRSRMQLRRYEQHLFGPRGARYLATEAGRNRLR